MYKVYILEFPNGKKYCGQTKRTLERRAGTDGIHYKKSPKVYNAIQKFGWDNVVKTIIADYDTKEEADVKEIETIANLHLQDDRFGYNISKGGDGVDSETSSKTSKEHWQNPEFREKVSNSLKEYCNTEEGKLHHQKVAQQNKQRFGYTVVQYDLSTGNPIACFPSYADAVCHFTGQRHGTAVRRVVVGERASYRGYGWRQPTEEDIKYFDLDENGKIPLNKIQ